jgi:protein PhnA
MKLEQLITQRSQNICELCAASTPLVLFEVPPVDRTTEDNCIMICSKCLQQIEKKVALDHKHWDCLSTAMWSEVPGIQVVSWRMLNRLSNESWAADLLDMLYLDDDKLAWAKATGDHDNDGTVDLHLDSNGQQLFTGDSVVLTKSLDVKGTSLNAKMGTVVKNIRLVPDNTEQIEGKIEGQMIVILTKYVRKA